MIFSYALDWFSAFLKNNGFNHTRPKFEKGTQFIDVRDRIASLSDEQLIKAANEYWENIGADAEQTFKPFHNADDSSRLLLKLSTLFEKAKLQANHRVLDFGCGSGFLSISLSKMNIEAHGIDIAEDAISLAKFCATKERGSGACHFKSFDGYNIPFEDNYFDRILTFDAFHHVSQPEKILKEFKRILRPGGRVVMSEPGFEHSEAPHSQRDMRDFDVIENTLDIEQIARVLEESKLTPPTFFFSVPHYETTYTKGEKKWLTKDAIHRHFVTLVSKKRPVNWRHHTGFEFYFDKPSKSREIIFNDEHPNCKKYLKHGFYDLEKNYGVWTEGNESILSIPLKEHEKSDLLIRINVTTFIAPGREKFTVKLSIENKAIGQKVFTGKSINTDWFISVPKKQLSELSDIELKIRQNNVKSPKELNISPDSRKLSLAINSIELISAP